MKIDGKSLDVEQLRSFRSRLHSSLQKHLDIILQYEKLYHRAMHVRGDLSIDGDLVLDEAEIQVLLVEGDLKVSGRIEDRNDEEFESLILVSGNLETTDLFTWGTLEVHGNLTVCDHLLLLDNACMARIEGNLEASFLLDQYHHCEVLGQVRASTFIQDDARIETPHPPDFVSFEDDIIDDILPRELLEGEEDEEGFIVEGVDVETLAEWIREKRPVLKP